MDVDLAVVRQRVCGLDRDLTTSAARSGGRRSSSVFSFGALVFEVVELAQQSAILE
jgi:hypothetical protein